MNATEHAAAVTALERLAAELDPRAFATSRATAGQAEKSRFRRIDDARRGMGQCMHLAPNPRERITKAGGDRLAGVPGQ